MNLVIQLLALIGAGFLVWLVICVACGGLKEFVWKETHERYASKEEFRGMWNRTNDRLNELEKGLERAVSLIEAVASTTQNLEDYRKRDCGRLTDLSDSHMKALDRLNALEYRKAKSSF